MTETAWCVKVGCWRQNGGYFLESTCRMTRRWSIDAFLDFAVGKQADNRENYWRSLRRKGQVRCVKVQLKEVQPLTKRNPNEVIALAAGKPTEGYWWCPRCQDELCPEQVTYEELHATCQTGVVWVDPIDYSHPDNRGALDAVIRGMDEGQRKELKSALYFKWCHGDELGDYEDWLLFECPQTTLRDAVADVLGGE